MTTYLDAIIQHHRRRAAADGRSLADLLVQAADRPAPRGMTARLAGAPGVSVIAEVKRRSPSAGDLWGDLDPAALASVYRDSGAAALSVLTDEAHFGGSPDDLRAARAAAHLPVLRKDFTVCPADVCDARIMGADAVLLIAAALDDHELRDFSALAVELKLDPLVEVHDAAEIDRVAALGARFVGVNQRDLQTFDVDRSAAVRLAERLPSGAVTVAESGIRSGAEVIAVGEAGYDAVLIGQSFVGAGDLAAAGRAVADLVAAGR